MNGTPRLRSAFPETPRHEPGSTLRTSGAFPTSSTFSTPAQKRRSVIRPGSLIDATPPSYKRPLNAGQSDSPDGPHIPLSLIDAPTQRFFAVAFYLILQMWKLIDYAYYSNISQTESTWLLLKWTFIDGMYLTALPILRIPWLEFSFASFVGIWALHAVLDFWLMFNLSLPYGSVLTALARIFYNKELSLSDTRVNPGRLIDQADIILGKQIINLLPEGSAILNPAQISYCLDETTRTVTLPIQINQTSPETIEIFRYDLESEDEVETIIVGAKQAKKLKKEADKGYDKLDTATPRILHYPVSKKGLYRLNKVIDKSKLEVRRKSNDVAVVACPKARVHAVQLDKCLGDLSGVQLEVTGVPPFKVKYSKRINHQQFSSITQTVQSTDQDTNNIILDPKRPQMGWTQSKTLSFDINESLAQNGTWVYTVEEVIDGLSNQISYDDPTKKAPAHVSQDLTVHKRPKMKFNGCDAERFLRVAREDSMRMPVDITSHKQLPASDWPLKFKYTFTPQADGAVGIESLERNIANEHDLPLISKAGRYDITGIESRFCAGEVNEPSSCLLYNPPKPSLNYQIEEIFDKCAGRPIGTIVNFDFTGTPPFKVWYDVTKAGAGSSQKEVDFKGMRGQIELRERSAGSYRYQISAIRDDVYNRIELKSAENSFEQNIRPPAEAFFKTSPGIKACLNSPVSVEVKLLGEGPWDLDYEIVHSGKRKKYSHHADDDNIVIEVPPQSVGGKYTVVLTSIQDSSRCRTALKEERHIEVRPEQPRASFGNINGKRTVQALESKDVKIPIKLQGLPPWKVKIQSEKGERDFTFRSPNEAITADVAGVYQITSVSDNCPGIVDLKADKFEVAWIKRPELHIRDDSVQEAGNRMFRKQPVCQGDEDKIGLSMSGHSPYHIKYAIKADPIKDKSFVSNKPLSLASNKAFVNMDTSRAGEYTYTFNELADDRYSHDRKHFAPLVVKQQVYALPTAKFAKTDKKPYGYCKEDDDAPGEGEIENIPIVLTGEPPFNVELAIRKHGNMNKPDYRHVKALANTFSWQLPRSLLGLGLHVIEIRSVKDARGCETIVDPSMASFVKVQVSAPPKILPLDTRTDFCVGDHLAFSLSGQAPFDIFYKFQDKDRKAHINSHEFRRISDYAGEFIVTAIEDSVPVGKDTKCRAKQDIRKIIHPYPTVRISHGKTLTTDIHEGGEVEIVFEFTGSPPFEFTYTRSENAKLTKGHSPRVLETKHDSSNEFTKTVRASDEGTYEVVSIKDRHCSYAAPSLAKMEGKGQKLLT